MEEIEVVLAVVAMITGAIGNMAYVGWRIGKLEGTITQRVQSNHEWIESVESRVERLETQAMEG